YEHLVADTPDKGKDTAITLDWDDPEIFKEIIRQRLSRKSNLSGSFEDMWSVICDGFVGTQNSFTFIADRTLMRPRDLLMFLHRAIETAINRGHSKITSDDLIKAEAS